MKLNKVLVLFKKSAYQVYFLEKKSPFYRKQNLLSSAVIKRFQNAHEGHYKTLAKVEEVLSKRKIRYEKVCRGESIKVAGFDLIITVGGDGTFLEAARVTKIQPILGVNSDTRYSMGRLCSVHARNFGRIIGRIQKGQHRIKLFNRIRLVLQSKYRTFTRDAVNDILISHQNPAATSRYLLAINKVKEEHRNSGLWIATGAGSSGAINSAGGKLLAKESKKIQYVPRELYRGFNPHYRLKGSVLPEKASIRVESLMPDGVIFVDGAHFKYPFVFGDRAKIVNSSRPLKVVSL